MNNERLDESLVGLSLSLLLVLGFGFSLTYLSNYLETSTPDKYEQVRRLV